MGLYYDPQAPEQQGVIHEKINSVRTLIDLDPDHEKEGAR